jgi:ParB family chromosome partitioning protein
LLRITGAKLVAGVRRIEAYKSLGKKTIPAIVANNLQDARLLLLAERDENDCRLDFTTLEAVALGEALEELEGPKAKERMKAGKKQPSGKFSEGKKGETREIIGKAIGMSGPTFQRAD